MLEFYVIIARFLGGEVEHVPPAPVSYVYGREGIK